MSSTVPHGEAGSVDVEYIAEGMEAIRLTCLDYDMGNIFNVDETGIFRLCLLYTSPSPRDKRQSRMPSSA